MIQTYMMKASFDGIHWYQLEWQDVEFRNFEEVGKPCNSIEELNAKILEAFPDSNLKYEYIGERKEKKTSSPTTTKKRKKT